MSTKAVGVTFNFNRRIKMLELKLEKIRNGYYKVIFGNYELIIDQYEGKWYGNLSKYGIEESYWEGKTKKEIKNCFIDYFTATHIAIKG